MSPTSPVTGVTISDLPAVQSPLLELPGSYREVEVPTGPVANAYVNKKVTPEQEAEYLQSLIGSAAGVSAFQLDPNTYFVSPALQAVAVANLVWLHPDYTTSTVAGSYPPNRAPILTTTGRPTDGSVLAYLDAGANIVPVPLAGGSGLPSGTTFRDPLAIGDDLVVTAAVLDASNTWSNGDLTAYGSASLSTNGAPPAVSGQHSSILVGTADVQNGDQFDGVNSSGSAYRHFYGRRNDGTSGWTRIAKL